MRGNSNLWPFNFMLNFMWQNDKVDSDRYQLCVGIVRDPKSGNSHDHAWIEDTTTGEVIYKYKFKRRVEHTPKEDYYRLMHPSYVKRYSGREMFKKVFKVGVQGLLENVPLKVSSSSNFKGHWDDGRRFRKQTRVTDR